MDTAKTLVQKVHANARRHKGRTIAFKGRASKKWAIEPLQDRVVRRAADGSFRGIGTESNAEVREPMTSKFRTGSLQSSDSAPAFQSVNKNDSRLKKVWAVTVKHGSPKMKDRQFVKTCHLPVKHMTPKLVQTLRRQAPKRSPNARKLPVKAGDNCVEGLYGNISQLQRRLNLKGRGTATKAHVNMLASAWLLRDVGLDHVLKAMRMYRTHVQDKIAPKDAFNDVFWVK